MSFEIYKKDPASNGSISSSSINIVYEAVDNKLWIGTAEGLNIFHPETETFSVYLHNPDNPQSISNDYVTSICEDNDGYLWVGTAEGLNIFHPETETFSVYLHDPDNPQSISNSRVNEIYEDSNGTIWIGTNEGLNVFHPETETFSVYLHDPDNPQSISNNRIEVIYEDSRGTIWIGTAEGLNIFHPETETFSVYDYGDSYSTVSTYITCICEDDDDYIWIGTPLGLYKLDTEKGTSSIYIPDGNDPNSINTDRIKALYKDAEGILWIGTLNGINRLNFNKQAFRYYIGILNNNAVSNICSVDSNTIWFKTRLGPIEFNTASHTVEAIWSGVFTDQSFSSGGLNTFYVGADGCMWAGTENSGLNRFYPATNKLVTYTNESDNENSLPSNTITSLYISSDGTIWIGTTGGLCSLNPETEEFTRYTYITEQQGDITCSNVHIAYETSDGDLWFGADSGIYRLDSETGEIACITYSSWQGRNPTGITVYSFCESSNGLVWMGSDSGLYCYNPEENMFVSHGMEEILPTTLAHSVLEDNSGDIWFATSQGLGRLSIKGGTYTRFSTEDGMENNLLCIRASHKTEDGELFFGCVAGLISFYPEDIKEDTTSPKVVINDFSLIDKDISFTEPIEEIKKITLPYSDNSFTVDFVALHYSSSEQIQYAYKLDGFEDNWNYCSASESFTKYTNIPSGEYTFMVRAANSDGIWNDEGASLKITITPPFWQEWWFMFTLIGVTVLFIFIVIRLRTHALHIRAQELEVQVADRTSQLAEKSEQLEKEMKQRIEFTRALVHELKTPLTAIMSSSELLMKKPQSELYPRLAKNIHVGVNGLNNRINELLDLARGEIGKLKINPSYIDSLDVVRQVVDEMTVEADKKRQSIVLESPDSLPLVWADDDRLQQILLNIISNAIKYGPDKSTIKVAVREENGHVTFIVQDEGAHISLKEQNRLFQPYYRKESDREHLNGLGIGLALSKTLVELHGGQIWVKSQKDCGNIFGFSIPIKAKEQPRR